MLHSQVLNVKNSRGCKVNSKIKPDCPERERKIYYEKEDEYTEIIKENKHLLLDNDEDGPIDEEEAFIWKVSYGEYELAEDGGIILDSTAASVFYVGDLVKVVFEDEEDQIGIYRVVKVTDTQCICEFVK